jgi:hypothetical protein
VYLALCVHSIGNNACAFTPCFLAAWKSFLSMPRYDASFYHVFRFPTAERWMSSRHNLVKSQKLEGCHCVAKVYQYFFPVGRATISTCAICFSSEKIRDALDRPNHMCSKTKFRSYCVHTPYLQRTALKKGSYARRRFILKYYVLGVTSLSTL